MIYLDSAATSYYRPDSVALAVADAVRHMGNSSRGIHDAALDASRTIYQVREKLGEMFGCGPSQIAFASNVTESLNTALCGLLRPGDHVVTTVLEHNSVLRPLYRLEQQGVELSIAGCDTLGTVCPEDIQLCFDRIPERSSAHMHRILQAILWISAGSEKRPTSGAF